MQKLEQHESGIASSILALGKERKSWLRQPPNRNLCEDDVAYDLPTRERLQNLYRGYPHAPARLTFLQSSLICRSDQIATVSRHNGSPIGGSPVTAPPPPIILRRYGDKEIKSVLMLPRAQSLSED